jgi:nitroimidazol reductase NimA-like FMN-containing flavoprotein (pyridoxamine 5'-phosphate oxidase superfamily)
MSQILSETERTRLRRIRERGHFDRVTIDGVLDAVPMCHIGYVIDDAPIVMPTLQWREGDHVYWHASNGGRGAKAWRHGEVCLTVSILDGLVLARSGLHHSANYRSVMVFGRPERIDDQDVKRERLGRLIDSLFPGRNAMLRPMTDSEVKRTALFRLSLTEASAKVRTGGPVDDEADYDLPIWAGTVPITLSLGTPKPDPRNLDGVLTPQHVEALKLG